MKNSLRIHKWTHNEFNIFILGVLTRPLKKYLHLFCSSQAGVRIFLLLSLSLSEIGLRVSTDKESSRVWRVEWGVGSFRILRLAFPSAAECCF